MPKIVDMRAASRIALPVAGAAVALALLAGCASGSGSSAAGQVASMPSQSSSAGSSGQSSATAATSQPTPGGPALSAYATAAQRKAILGPWYRCLGAHGTPLAMTAKLPGLMAPTGTIPAAASKACLSLQPHTPSQEIPADNPNYNVDMAKWINCMNARGVGVKATPGGVTAGGWTFTHAYGPADQNQIVSQCEAKAFGEA